MRTRTLLEACVSTSLVVALAGLASAARAPTAPAQRANKPLAELPMTSPFGLVFVQVSVEGSAPHWLGFDTGASQTFLDRTWAEELGFEIEDAGSSAQPGGRVQFGLVHGATMRLGELEWSDRTFGAVDLVPLSGAIGRPLFGIIGYDLLTSFVVELDYAEERMRLYDSGEFEYRGDGTSLDITIRRTKALLPVQLTRRDGEELAATFLVDTGSTQAVGLAPKFYRRALAPDQRSVPARGWGFGGTDSQGRLLRIARLDMGPFEFDDIACHAVVDDGTSGRFWDGIVGGELLRRFTIVFDYSRNRMIVEANAQVDQPVRESLSGMELAADGAEPTRIEVFAVYEGSPADRAGVREGDVLLEVDGASATSLGLDGLWELLRSSTGREHRLRMRRGGKEREVTIQLARLPL